MRIPQVNDRVKEAPVQVLRAVFAGIGQLMSTADKIRNKPASAEAPAAPRPATPKPAASEPAAAETAAQATVAPETAVPETAAQATVAPQTAVPETAAQQTVAPEAVTAETAAVASVAPETAVPETAPETVAPAPVVPKTVPRETVAPEVKPEPPVTSGGHVRLLPPDEVPAAATAAGQLPVPNYDGLSVASLRARLRNLSADQIGQLIDYEKGHAGRADVITMFERRLAKLADG
jgi:hypothetical protein